MTRDIRVALLIGLAFITLFGIVLGRRSLKLSSATASEEAAPPAAPTDRPGPEVAAIEVQRDDDRSVLSPARPSSRRVAASAPVPAPAPARPAEVAAAAPPPARPEAVVVGYSAAPARSAEAAEPRPAPTPPQPARPPVAMVFLPGPDPAPAAALRKTYCVQAGDNLRKIARKVYGADHEDKYVLIHQANKDRLRDPQTVIVGQVLTIPPLAAPSGPGGGAVTPRTASTPPPAPAPRPRDVAAGAVAPRAASTSPPGPAPRARAVTGATTPARPPYAEASAERLGDALRRMVPGRPARQVVVGKGDSLTKIAAREMGSGSAANVRKLIEANKGAMNDPNRVIPGMKLRIPQ